MDFRPEELPKKLVEGLLLYASEEFKKLGEAGGEDMSAHLAQLAKSTGGMQLVPDFVNPHPFPMLLGYLWQVFLRLSNGRGSTGLAPGTITYAEILAYSALHGVCFTDWEIEAMRKLDAVYLKTMTPKDE